MIYTSHYKDQPAITLETGHVRAQFLPALGGKVSALVALDHNFDVLVHRPQESYRIEPYDGVYVDGECSGFDDMFPTIALCYCEDAPWQGTKLADHGEVWSLPWNLVSAVGMIMVIPIIILVIFAQRAIVSGLTRGAIK